MLQKEVVEENVTQYSDTRDKDDDSFYTCSDKYPIIVLKNMNPRKNQKIHDVRKRRSKDNVALRQKHFEKDRFNKMKIEGRERLHIQSLINRKTTEY